MVFCRVGILFYLCRTMSFADVILPLPLEGVFTYSVPSALQSKVQERVRVQVPLGKSKTYLGIVKKVHDQEPKNCTVKPIISVIDDNPILLPQQIKLWEWIADYYMSPIGEVYNAALPQGMKSREKYKPKTETYVRLSSGLHNEDALHLALSSLSRAMKQQKVFMRFLELSRWETIEGTLPREAPHDVSRDELLNASHSAPAVLKALIDRNYLETYEKEVGRLNYGGEPHLGYIQPLSEAQQEAYKRLKGTSLLHGVTGSGKTEVYIHLIRDAIAQGKQVLYLLPEIALTVQIMQRLQKVFGRHLGIYHSKYSDAERVEIWQKQLSDEPYDVILGARSAVFLPFKKLGLVIIDEEHETSFKQQDPAPRYHARSAALVLARMYGADTVLGTATPSMETYYNARHGKYNLVELKTRYKGVQLPEINVVDIKDLQHRKMMNGPFSPLLLNKVREALANGGQVILFQNRRGFSPVLECRKCGWVPRCKNCDVSLTYHKLTNTLSCHYCGYTYIRPEKCPSCEEADLWAKGFGTEKIEDHIATILPEARIARMDLDTARTRAAYERIINDFAAQRTNLLIGTQMVSKGLDFDNVFVVGILNADSMLNYPDFRAYEHAYMMMAQVSGRAGRKGKQGLVILQTKNPKLPVIQQVVHNDYKAFYDTMLAERQTFKYPPFCHLIYVVLKHKDDPCVEASATQLARQLRAWFGARVLGPERPGVARVKSQNIRQIILKLENGIDMKKVREYLRMAQNALLNDQRFRNVMVYYDVDPL